MLAIVDLYLPRLARPSRALSFLCKGVVEPLRSFLTLRLDQTVLKAGLPAVGFCRISSLVHESSSSNTLVVLSLSPLIALVPSVALGYALRALLYLKLAYFRSQCSRVSP